MANQTKRFVGEVVVLDRDCELGQHGERAVVVELSRDGSMQLCFVDRDLNRRSILTGSDYRFLVPAKPEPTGKITHAVIYGHHRSAVADHPTVELAESLDAAADIVERVAKSYGFTFADRILCNEEGEESEDTEVREGRLIRFTHSDGEGPVALTVEVK